MQMHRHDARRQPTDSRVLKQNTFPSPAVGSMPDVRVENAKLLRWQAPCSSECAIRVATRTLRLLASSGSLRSARH
jgi:hypothetical protein